MGRKLGIIRNSSLNFRAIRMPELGMNGSANISYLNLEKLIGFKKYSKQMCRKADIYPLDKM